MEHGSRAGYAKHGCRCELCREAQQRYQREYRRRKRLLQPVVLAPVAPEPVAAGPVVAAVEADIGGLGELRGYRALAAAAVAMARILDSDGHVPTMPAAAKQLASLLDTLHREAGPRRGRLAVVQEMSKP
jgi:hypothetical protein